MFSVSSLTVATTMQVLCVFGFLPHLLESWLCKWKSYPLSLFYMLYLSFLPVIPVALFVLWKCMGRLKIYRISHHRILRFLNLYEID